MSQYFKTWTSSCDPEQNGKDISHFKEKEIHLSFTVSLTICTFLHGSLTRKRSPYFSSSLEGHHDEVYWWTGLNNLKSIHRSHSLKGLLISIYHSLLGIVLHSFYTVSDTIHCLWESRITNTEWEFIYTLTSFCKLVTSCLDGINLLSHWPDTCPW